MSPLHGDRGLVGDARSFSEGEGERWARAKYGEFRVGATRRRSSSVRGADLEKL